MSDIEKIAWDPKYSVDIEEIDAYQKKMFELFNKLIDIKRGELEFKLCINMISEISEHSKLYFSTEEKYMKKKGYPDFGAHSKAHRQFIKSFISLRREISEDIENLTDDVIIQLRDWMTNHILTFDSLYVPFLRIDKYIEESKQKN
ncbi:MAG: bacteriohemerythrin [Desulfobacula sp.]|uniref:bacteriohemerythrin n=1 Tax=Desulfobacula sp. TaxID=2593537 RepID=UPI0025BEE5C3|nr:bacteriohemerythrin [Desulfobacula sp.]MCD4722259.1 bacteriohemerythrin [Desulfobacula sp.]